MHSSFDDRRLLGGPRDDPFRTQLSSRPRAVARPAPDRRCVHVWHWVTGLSGAGASLDVLNSGGNSITGYATAASGDAAPLATIIGSNTGLNGPVGVSF